ncbi:MAG: peptidoglycan binding domain-containing protein, partial [Gaiellaceae bacterium]
TWLDSRPVLKTLAALVCSAGVACAAAPASTPAHLIAHGVTVSGVHVGGMTAVPARDRITAALMTPIQIATPAGVTTIDPARAGAVADIDAALAEALAARPGLSLTVHVDYSADRAATILSDLAATFDKPAVSATVTGADAAGPVFSPARPGVAVDRRTMGAAIGDLLRSGERRPLTLLTNVVPPKRTAAGFGPVIVVNRAENTLRLYNGTTLVRAFRVATGQSIYPTPAGSGTSWTSSATRGGTRRPTTNGRRG